MKAWKAAVLIILLVVVAVLAGYLYQNSKREHVIGVYSYSGKGVAFLLRVGVDGTIGESVPDNQVSHNIDLIFTNQEQAVKMLNIDISTLRDPLYCVVYGQPAQEIVVRGYDASKVTGDPSTWRQNVELVSVVTRSQQKTYCDSGDPY